MKLKGSRLQKAGFILTGVIGIAVVSVFGCMLNMSGERRVTPVIFRSSSGFSDENQTPQTIRVLTLNLAHGRKDGFHQFFLDEEEIRAHLDDIAAVFLREKPHLIGGQETDGPSFWSGGFDHAVYLAETSGLPFAVRGSHMNGAYLDYGTAIWSRLEMSEPVSSAFAPSPPTPTKGFVAAALKWPGDTDFIFDAVSLHLDFSSASVREKQVTEVADLLQSRNRPAIVMGDFNCGWKSREKTLRILAEKRGLSPFRGDAEDLTTFPEYDSRLDWILISPEFMFAGYKTLPDILSDHLGVTAVIGRKK